MPAGSTEQTATSYRHLELGRDIATGIAGVYTPEKEVRLAYNGREVLYVVGEAMLSASCCGVGNWVYVAVPGYVISWHSSKDGVVPISEVEPIGDPQAREELRKIIELRESTDRIQFS
jgi:hypothetical protein